MAQSQPVSNAWHTEAMLDNFSISILSTYIYRNSELSKHDSILKIYLKSPPRLPTHPIAAFRRYPIAVEAPHQHGFIGVCMSRWRDAIDKANPHSRP